MSLAQNNENRAETLADRLRMCLADKQISLPELSRRLGLPYVSLTRIFNGETSDPKASTLKILADYFGTTVDALLRPSAIEAIKTNTQNQPHHIPILSWEEVGRLEKIGDLDLSAHTQWETVARSRANELSEECFALEGTAAMEPRYTQGTIFIVDMNEHPRNGDIVVVKIQGSDGITLRELVVDPPHWCLTPLVRGSEKIVYDETLHKIKGVVALAIFHPRKHP